MAVLAGLLLQVMSPQVAAACGRLVDEQGHDFFPVVEPQQFFVGTLTSVRTPDARDIEQLRARWKSRRPESDAEVIGRFLDSTRIAEFEVEPGDRSRAATVALWFEGNGNCPGPYNEGLPLEVGQRAVVFSDVVDGWLTGWIPNSVNVQKLGQPQLVETMEHLFQQFDQCPEGAHESYGFAVTFLRAPRSGFGRGCLVEAR